MRMKLKTKLSIGLIFLFTVILLFGILGIATINRLSKDANLILKDNQESLLYCNNMFKFSRKIFPGRKTILPNWERKKPRKS